MISSILNKIGFDSKEIEVYLSLLRLGPTRASTIAYRLNLPRTTVQNILLRLEEDNFVTKSQEKNVHIYTAVHPQNLPRIIEMRKRQQSAEYDSVINELEEVAPQLVGMMKTSKSLPNVKFYRGREAAHTVLFDTLNSKTELKDFTNIDAMFEHIKDINDEYVAEREKTKITKRSLLLDTEFARRVYESGLYSSKSHKGYKWIDRELYPFLVEMNIYDGKVSYLTYVEDEFIGVIIENDYIYQMHDSLWNLIWDQLPEPECVKKKEK